MFGLDELQDVIPPPSSPRVTMTDDLWIEVFGQFGTRLPADFVEFHQRYGEGYFYSRSHPRTAGVQLWHGSYERFSFQHQVPKRLSELRRLKEERPKSILLPLYWESNGLLPWAMTTNDTDLCWVVRGSLVDNWQVAAVRPASRRHELFECSAIQFLARVLKGSITCSLLPEHFPGARGAAYEVWRFGPTAGGQSEP